MSASQLSLEELEAIGRALQGRIPQRSDRLTLARARSLLTRLKPEALVVAETADDEALALLRAEERSYHVRSTNEVYLAPAPRLANRTPTSGRPTSPFAPRASRICRQLLLHANEEFTINALAEAAEVDKSVVSRVVAELKREALIRVETSSTDARLRVVRLTEPRRLLELWRITWRRSRPAPMRFDIGTSSFEQTLQVIADASGAPRERWALSGLAGASFLRRVVQPTDVLLLTTPKGLAEWRELLFAEPTPDRGFLRIAVMRDPFVLRLSWRHGKLHIADPVQLWLDTASVGERAADAADAITKEMGW